MAQIYSQIWLSGDPKCMEPTCPNPIADKETATFIVGSQKTIGFCCVSCMIRFCGKYLDQDKTNRKIGKRNLLREMGYKQPTAE
jgi:hypothetical protein